MGSSSCSRTHVIQHINSQAPETTTWSSPEYNHYTNTIWKTLSTPVHSEGVNHGSHDCSNSCKDSKGSRDYGKRTPATSLSGVDAVLYKLPIYGFLFVRPFLPQLTLLCVKGGAVYKVGWMSGRGRCGTACKGTCPWMWGYRCKAGCVGFSGLINWWPGGRAAAVSADAGSPEASCLQTWHSQVSGACSAYKKKENTCLLSEIKTGMIHESPSHSNRKAHPDTPSWPYLGGQWGTPNNWDWRDLRRRNTPFAFQLDICWGSSQQSWHPVWAGTRELVKVAE